MDLVLARNCYRLEYRYSKVVLGDWISNICMVDESIGKPVSSFSNDNSNWDKDALG